MASNSEYEQQQFWGNQGLSAEDKNDKLEDYDSMSTSTKLSMKVNYVEFYDNPWRTSRPNYEYIPKNQKP